MTENQLKISVQKWLKTIGAFGMKLSDRFTSGHPDMIIFYKGRTICIELKTMTGVASKLQLWTMAEIVRNGGEAHICRTLSEVKSIILGPSTNRNTTSCSTRSGRASKVPMNIGRC